MLTANSRLYITSIHITQQVKELSTVERVAAVRPFWEGQSQEERVKLLTVSVDELRARAKGTAGTFLDCSSFLASICDIVPFL